MDFDRTSDPRSKDDKRSRTSRAHSGDQRVVKRHRSRSPGRHRPGHRTRSPKAKLAFGSRHLHKHDFESYQALFSEYLDLQKSIDVDSLSEDEVKGRWKSFLGKWNRGELAEGWYDPETKTKADQRAAETRRAPMPERIRRSDHIVKDDKAGETDSEGEDGYGPALPHSGGLIHGPSIPSLQDLQHVRELAEEDREARKADMRYERKQDRSLQKERLEEIVPRADPGSRERQMEKKRETAISNKAFGDAKEAGTEEVAEGDLMGDDGIDGFKAKKRAREKVKNEREIRKEEMLRARAAEREEKFAEHRRKEDKTMDMLRQLAQQRFGSGS